MDELKNKVKNLENKVENLEEALSNILIEAIDNLSTKIVLEIITEKYSISEIIDAIYESDDIAELLDKDSLLHGLKSKDSFDNDDLDDIIDISEKIGNNVIIPCELLDEVRMLEYLKEHLAKIKLEDLELIIKGK